MFIEIPSTVLLINGDELKVLREGSIKIEEIIKSAGAKNVSVRETYGGAKFEYNLDDKVNEREIKKLIQDMLRRKNYHSF